MAGAETRSPTVRADTTGVCFRTGRSPVYGEVKLTTSVSRVSFGGFILGAARDP